MKEAKASPGPMPGLIPATSAAGYVLSVYNLSENHSKISFVFVRFLQVSKTKNKRIKKIACSVQTMYH